MPNTREEWDKKVENAIEVLAEAAAMEIVTPDVLTERVSRRLGEFKGKVPTFKGDGPEDFGQMREQALRGDLTSGPVDPRERSLR